MPGAVGYLRMWWPHRVVRGASEGKTGLLAKGELWAVPGRRGALSASQRRVFIYLFQVDVMSALGTVQTSEAAPIPVLLTVFEPRSHGPRVHSAGPHLAWVWPGNSILRRPGEWAAPAPAANSCSVNRLVFIKRLGSSGQPDTSLWGNGICRPHGLSSAPGLGSPLPPDSHHFGAQDP